MLYFVLPSQAECREEGAHKGSKLTFDVTYISPGDSLRLNASLLLPQIQKVDSLTFQDAQGKNQTFPTERLYLEPRKSKWELRLSIQVPYALWQTFAQRTDTFDLPLQPQRPTGGQLQFLRQSVAPATRHLSADRTDEK